MRGGVRRAAFEREFALAKEFIAKGELETGFSHLERAHVIGQIFVVPHARSHGLILTLEIRRRQPVAALGQVARLVLGILGSAVGKVPVGNTGGSNVSMFKTMPISPELKSIIEGSQLTRGLGGTPEVQAADRNTRTGGVP
jgi:hypothetical protein